MLGCIIRNVENPRAMRLLFSQYCIVNYTHCTALCCKTPPVTSGQKHNLPWKAPIRKQRKHLSAFWEMVYTLFTAEHNSASVQYWFSPRALTSSKKYREIGYGTVWVVMFIIFTESHIFLVLVHNLGTLRNRTEYIFAWTSPPPTRCMYLVLHRSIQTQVTYWSIKIPCVITIKIKTMGNFKDLLGPQNSFGFHGFSQIWIWWRGGKLLKYWEQNLFWIPYTSVCEMVTRKGQEVSVL